MSRPARFQLPIGEIIITVLAMEQVTIDVRAAIQQGAPNPTDALRRFERILGDVSPQQLFPKLSQMDVHVLRLCCQHAPYLATLLARDPQRTVRVATDSYLLREKPQQVFASELHCLVAKCRDEAHLAAALRDFRADELVRLGVRELEFGTAVEVGRELSRLAEVCLDVAIEFYTAQLTEKYGPPLYTDEKGNTHPAHLCVVGMGKLGGEELNFISDIDILYVYSSDSGHAGGLTLHEYFCKLAECITSCLAEVTDKDVVFHVDLRLRPEGARGVIANSLPSLERYYESWGHPWERQAWLKARPCAGNKQLGTAVLETLRPFIYPHSSSSAVIQEVIKLNQRIKAGLKDPTIERGFDVKNGHGGIRDIEFFVQALQLLHAGKNPAVRVRGTRPALDALLFAGFIDETEHRILSDAYEFLRRIEHLLQLESGRQTQRLPSAANDIYLLALRSGHNNTTSFEEHLETHSRAAATLFASLGEPDQAPPQKVLALLARTSSRDQEITLLQHLGFRDPKGSQQVLESIRRRPLSPFAPQASGARARVAPELLTSVSRCPDPDQALRHLNGLVTKAGTLSGIWRLFDANSALMQLIISLFGTSEYLARRFVDHPELIDRLVESGRASTTYTPDQLYAELNNYLRGVTPHDNEEDFWNRLAEFKNAHVLRIGLADIGGVLTTEEVTEQLSTVAEVCLTRALDTISTIVELLRGTPRDSRNQPVTMAVLALGKLGGREIGYASDLDLIFVYSADGESDGQRPLDNVTYMTRIAQRLMGGLHALHPGGRLYEVDTRLRPSGSKGLLVSSLAAWNRYHKDHAWLWERQALTKLRFVAGDKHLGYLVTEAARTYAYSPERDSSAAEIAAAVHDMRERIESERNDRSSSLDVKTGPGGLIDVEFAAQYLQLVHGHAHTKLQNTSTVRVLEEATNFLPDLAQDCTLLVEGYRFLRHLENRMRIVHDQSVHRLPQDVAALETLARRAGFPDGPSLHSAFVQWTSDIRNAYRRILGTP